MLTPKLRVAICGGGVGGLTCALALSKYSNIELDIYEAATEFGEIGAGIGLWPRALEVLQLLGLADDLMRVAGEPGPNFNFRKSDEAQGLAFSQLNAGQISCHRAEFQQVLLKHLPSTCRTHFRKRLQLYQHMDSESVELRFADGTTAFCHVLVGADGIKSSVRGTLFRQIAQEASSQGRSQDAAELLSFIDPVWSGIVAYRALIPTPQILELAARHSFEIAPILPTLFLGKNANAVTYPVSQGRLINFVAFKCRHDLAGTQYEGSWVGPAGSEELRAPFSKWEPDVQALVGCINSATRWAIHTTKPLPTYVGHREALIGDAAHAMVPYQGAGAGQAIEDAFLLATVLGHPNTTLSTIPRALKIYDSLRRPFATQVAARSMQNAYYFSLSCKEFDFGGGDSEAKMCKLQEMGRAISHNWEWAWTTSVSDALREATHMLDSQTLENDGSLM